MSQIIGNKSEGHNYHYASLADIARQGIAIPPMRVAPVFDHEGRLAAEYVEAFVSGEWITGARVVVPSSTRSNEAQNYGAALTYARRYTVLTLMGIACDDDDKIETHSEADQKANEEAAKDELKALYEKAGGKDFEKWLKDCGGLSNRTYPAMKAKLMKQIADKAEGEKKA